MRAPDRLGSALFIVVWPSLTPTAGGQEVERFPPGPPVPTTARWDRPDHRFLLTPQVATLLSRDDVEAISPVTTDGLLGQIPGFSLTGAAPSLVADPPSLGVSLRSAGPGVAHRSLVLVDGVPANDPFGGWVPWAGIPPTGIARVEVVHGASPGVWGNRGAGLILVTTRARDTHALRSGPVRRPPGFEDNLNTLRLGGAVVVTFRPRRPWARGASCSLRSRVSWTRRPR